MKKDKKLHPELITMERVVIVKSHVSADDHFIENPQKPDQIKIQHKQHSSFNYEQKKVRIRLTTFLEGVDKNKDGLGLTGKFVFDFYIHVENFDDFVIEENNQKSVDGLLGSTLMGIIYSTARGIILENTKGTLMGGVMLPVIDPKELIRGNS